MPAAHISGDIWLFNCSV